MSKIRIIFAVCRLPFAVNVMLNLSNSEIKHAVKRQTANASLPFILPPFCRILKQMRQKNREKNHTFTTNTNLLILRTNAKRQTAEVEFLPLAGKTNVMLNLSNISYQVSRCKFFCYRKRLIKEMCTDVFKPRTATGRRMLRTFTSKNMLESFHFSTCNLSL